MCAEKYHEVRKKAIEDLWEEDRKDIVGTKEKLEDKYSKEVEDYLTKEVLPKDKTAGGTEIEKLKRKMTRYLFKKDTSPLDESVEESDESYMQFMKNRDATDRYHKRVLNSIKKPLSKRELEKVREIIEEMEKNNE